LHQLLIGLRRRNPWLVRARTTVGELTNTTLAYTASDGERQIAVTLNLAAQPASVGLPAGDWQLAEGTGKITGDGAELPAFGWLVANGGAPAVPVTAGA
jgi:hypothetical protein